MDNSLGVGDSDTRLLGLWPLRGKPPGDWPKGGHQVIVRAGKGDGKGPKRGEGTAFPWESMIGKQPEVWKEESWAWWWLHLPPGMVLSPGSVDSSLSNLPGPRVGLEVGGRWGGQELGRSGAAPTHSTILLFRVLQERRFKNSLADVWRAIYSAAFYGR